MRLARLTPQPSLELKKKTNITPFTSKLNPTKQLHLA
jgi:hypothetical protein